MPGEEARDEQVTNTSARFESAVFYVIYDTIIGELASRFADFQIIVTNFKCLMPQNLGDINAFDRLSVTYQDDVDVEL